MSAKYDYDWEKLHKKQQSGMNIKKFVEETSFLIKASKKIKIDMVSIVPVTYEEQ